jgi:hypothetical protein
MGISSHMDRMKLVKTKITLHSPSLRLEGDLEQLILIEYQNAFRDEGKVRHATISNGDLSEKNA